MHNRRPRRHDNSAFTLIELMNFLGLAAVISALAMYGVARYVRHTKTAEAVGSTVAIAEHAAVFYNESDAHQPAGTKPDSAKAMRHFPASSRASVPPSDADVKGTRYQSTMADWSISPWLDLRFSVTQPQAYAYSFESTGSGPSATASAIAHGDLDGNGITSTYRVNVSPDANGVAKVDLPVVKIEPEE